MLTLQNLLSYGYFPKELPPSFHTTLFSQAYQSGTMPTAGTQNTARLVRFNLARPDKSRRILGIPNPIFQGQLASSIVDNWTFLKNHINSADLSISRPMISSTFPYSHSRSVSAGNPSQQHELIRAEKRAGYRYVLKADINTYYSSIYTHSIPWALHTKATAKASMKGSPPFNSLYGNTLDKLVRESQDKQTVGIPVGPDTSLIIAECILATIDKECGLSNGFRYMDDYELSFSTTSEAERALGKLETVLQHYELRTNHLKTRLIEIPDQLYTHNWTSQISNHKISRTVTSQVSDLTGLFNAAFDAHRSSHGSGVLSYAIGRIKLNEICQENYNLLLSFILQSASDEPGALRNASRILAILKSIGHPIDLNVLEVFINNHIGYYGPSSHSSEVAWAIWLAILFSIPIHQSQATIISSMDDSVVALLALDANVSGLVQGGLNTTLWQKYMDTDELYGENWLLSYEANVKGWLPSVGGADHVMNDPFFGPLKTLNVSFYDRTRTIISSLNVAEAGRGHAPISPSELLSITFSRSFRNIYE